MLRAPWEGKTGDWSILSKRLYADESTWIRWRGVKQLRAWEALALHHHLDPDALNLSRVDPEQRNRLLQRWGDLASEDVLAGFTVQLVWLGSHIKVGSLSCVEINEGNLVDSITTVEHFARYVKDAKVFPRREDLLTIQPPASLPAECLTPAMEALFAAGALYRTVAEGGSYVPGDLHSAPNVAAFLRRRGGLSEKLISAIATILRPVNLPKGRPPARRPL